MLTNEPRHAVRCSDPNPTMMCRGREPINDHAGERPTYRPLITLDPHAGADRPRSVRFTLTDYQMRRGFGLLPPPTEGHSLSASVLGLDLWGQECSILGFWKKSPALYSLLIPSQV